MTYELDKNNTLYKAILKQMDFKFENQPIYNDLKMFIYNYSKKYIDIIRRRVIKYKSKKLEDLCMSRLI